MDRHVNLLGILAWLWGALAMLVGAALLLLAAGAIVPMFDQAGGALHFAAGLTAGVFAILGVFALLWGGAHAWASVLLRRHEPLGRMLTLALALIDLLVLPFGTALGVYALWVLLTNDGRRLFEPHPTPAAQ